MSFILGVTISPSTIIQYSYVRAYGRRLPYIIIWKVISTHPHIAQLVVGGFLMANLFSAIPILNLENQIIWHAFSSSDLASPAD